MNNNENILEQTNQVQHFENIINWNMINNNTWEDLENNIPISPIINSGPKYILMKKKFKIKLIKEPNSTHRMKIKYKKRNFEKEFNKNR
tara:strand:- start:391 stop:657 length:267 start_codon:yes stop_codon:yes gene_type:complete